MFNVNCEGKTIDCKLMGKTRKKDDIVVGDFVELVKENSNYYISGRLDRSNCLVRPRVANVELLVIVLSLAPKPDFLLIDKLILQAKTLNIDVILCVNKLDILNNEFIDEVKFQYQNEVNDFIVLSAKNGNNIEKLKDLLNGKLSVFAGQSAVGKSTMLNALMGFRLAEEGSLSKKTERGKHTTKSVNIYELENNTFLVDTPGFTMLELNGLGPKDLSGLYNQFVKVERNCQFKGCEHINSTEKNCAVVDAVKKGKISEELYNRYVMLYKDVKEKWRKRYE